MYTVTLFDRDATVMAQHVEAYYTVREAKLAARELLGDAEYVADAAKVEVSNEEGVVVFDAFA